jgi:hypothetical protein
MVGSAAELLAELPAGLLVGLKVALFRDGVFLGVRSAGPDSDKE